MKFGKKYEAFVRTRADVEFLEGTTAAGKTTVGIFKFMLMVAESSKPHHIIAGLDKGIIEKNIINKDHGIADEWGELVQYYGNGRGNEGLPHLVFKTPNGIKTIYCLGYSDKTRWRKALGGQYGCLFVDEVNIADIDFVREAAMRSDYVLATLNPDDPALPIYKEYINKARPMPGWEMDTPEEIKKMLTEAQVRGWVHWFFSFRDNIAMDEKKLEIIKQNIPVGTKIYKNKIEGLRGRATGLVFPNFGSRHIMTESKIRDLMRIQKVAFQRFTCGVDTAYSASSADTIAMLFQGITQDHKIITLEENILTNTDRNEPLAPSDVVKRLVNFLNMCAAKWGNVRHIFIDSADQATLTECQKWKRETGGIYIFNGAWKSMRIIDRINLQLGWLAHDEYLVCENCPEHIRELGVYSWQDGKDIPEDRNDHTINASQYGWLPYYKNIGAQNGYYGKR